MSRACSAHGNEEECMWNFGRKDRTKIPQGTPRWEDNIT
jgi:hypothetical protein